MCFARDTSREADTTIITNRLCGKTLSHYLGRGDWEPGLTEVSTRTQGLLYFLTDFCRYSEDIAQDYYSLESGKIKKTPHNTTRKSFAQHLDRLLRRKIVLKRHTVIYDAVLSEICTLVIFIYEIKLQIVHSCLTTRRYFRLVFMLMAHIGTQNTSARLHGLFAGSLSTKDLHNTKSF